MAPELARFLSPRHWDSNTRSKPARRRSRGTDLLPQREGLGVQPLVVHLLGLQLGGVLAHLGADVQHLVTARGLVTLAVLQLRLQQRDLAWRTAAGQR